MDSTLTRDEIESLRRLSSCQVADAIDALDVRLRNEGFMDASVRCLFPNLPPMVGYAVTAHVRTTQPPVVGRSYPDRAGWWEYIQTIPAPRVVVLEDLDRDQGLGSCAGEVHAQILKGLGCVGLVTNGGVRDLHLVEPIGFSFFAGNVALSSAYYHLLEIGLPVRVGGMQVKPGDLLHGDRHGVIAIPVSIAREIPVAAARISALERRVRDVAQSSHLDLQALRDAVQHSVDDRRG